MPTKKFQKGDPKPPNSGRKAGVSNILTIEIKEMVLTAIPLSGALTRAWCGLPQ